MCCLRNIKVNEYIYIGAAQRDQKQSHYNHTISFSNQRYKNATFLSSFLWELKNSTKEIPKLT